MSIKLEDLIPEEAEFTLALTKKTYKLRRFTLEDELWLKNRFGDELEKVFREIRMKEICQIVFHQLVDKSEFLKREVKIINEEGDEITETKGGAELLFCMISGMNEKLEIFNALLATIGISRPIQEKLAKEDSEKKSQ